MIQFWKDFPGMPELLYAVQARIGEAVYSENILIQDSRTNLFSSEGKMLRPGLLILASHFGKKDRDKIVALAAALEILHTATLVHDDVIDDSPLRRGFPATHVQYGKKNAVLIGDFLLSRCFLLTARYTSTDNAMAISKMMAVICSMELEQDADRYLIDMSVRKYLRKIMGKTALLFSLASYIGAAESKAPVSVRTSLRRIGYNIGMAFQIIDDILDYTGDPALVKKPVGNDLRAGLCTLPLICAIKRDKDGLMRMLLDRQAFINADVDQLIKTTQSLGGIDEASGYARRYTDRALHELDKLPAGTARKNMELLINKLLIRNY